MKRSLIEVTRLEKPTSRLQKYRLTNKGRTRLTEGGDTGSA